jgi:hypothetical protein
MKLLNQASSSYRRLAAGTGAMFIAVSLATPDPNVGTETPTVSDVERFYVDHAQDLQLAFLMTGAAYSLFLLFLWQVRSRLNRFESTNDPLWSLAVAAGVLVAAFHVLATALWAAPAIALHDDADPALIGAASLLSDNYRTALVEISTFWRGLLLGTVSVLVLRHGGLPRWLGWLAAVIAAAAFAGSIGFVDSPAQEAITVAGFGSYVGFHVWVLAASVALALRREAMPTVSSGPGQPAPA